MALTSTTSTTDLSVGRTSAGHREHTRLLRHYVEMVAAMALGMMLFGTLRAEVGITVGFADHPGGSYLLMATDMAVAMAIWMRRRRHSWNSTAQMCAAMYVPVLVVPLVWAGAVTPTSFMVLAHVVMLAAMLVILLRHRSGGRPR